MDVCIEYRRPNTGLRLIRLFQPTLKGRLLGDLQVYTALTTGHDIINRVFFADVTPALKLKNLREVDVNVVKGMLRPI